MFLICDNDLFDTLVIFGCWEFQWFVDYLSRLTELTDCREGNLAAFEKGRVKLRNHSVSLWKRTPALESLSVKLVTVAAIG